MISDIVWYEFSNYSISPLNFIIHHSFGTWELKLKFFKGFLCSFKIVVESNILLSFFLNMIILKCSPFFKRSKDKKNQKTLGRQSDNFCLPKLHVLCYWLLWTVLSTLFYAHLPSKHLISRHKIAFLIYSSSVHSPNMEIYNWVPPTKFTGARMTALKKRETFYIG